MKIADVIGTVVAPVQHPFYAGRKLLLIQPLDARFRPVGRAQVAVDRAQAGVGDRVLVLDEGSSARDLFGDPWAPVKTTVVGFIDEIEIRGDVVYRPVEFNSIPPKSKNKQSNNKQ
ncbi:MAG: EutN/CcmL family microcompartment protein [Planctomycetes bacterium]|nr:EutN/CcmL family microcompartment protein [Planctomycetota bacterium]